MANSSELVSMHAYVNRCHVSDIIAPVSFSAAQTADRELFMKTLAFFCALQDHGCSFTAASEYIGVMQHDGEHDESCTDSESDVEVETSLCMSSQRRQRSTSCRPKTATNACRGKPILRRDRHTKSLFIQ